MSQLETRERPKASSTVRTACPHCGGPLAVMRVIGGRVSEYWTMRCVRCGGFCLDIVKAMAPPRRG
jgi:uncharacterized Zn finger protein